MANKSLSPRVTGAFTSGTAGAAFVDLSHEITSGSTAYPGLPQPEVTPYLTHEQSRELYDDGYQFHTGQLCLVGQTGTYLDTPFHPFPDGYDLTRLDLRRVANVPATVVETDEQEIPADHFLEAGALGLTAFYCLAGRSAWPKSEAATILYRTVHDDVPVDELAVSGKLRALRRRVTAREPGDRPSPAEFLSALAETPEALVEQDPPGSTHPSD